MSVNNFELKVGLCIVNETVLYYYFKYERNDNNKDMGIRKVGIFTV